MGFFSRKPKVESNQFCEDYYNTFVFVLKIDGSNPQLHSPEELLVLLADIDEEFATVDATHLADELLALRLEIIGLAWCHNTKEKPSLSQSEFTKSYVSQIGQGRLWESMGAYNQVVAKSSSYGADTSTKSGGARVLFLNAMRAEFFDKWIKTGRDPEATARVANRLGSDVSWKAGTTGSLLGIELAKRLGHEGTAEIWTQLVTVVDGYYRDAVAALSDVTVTA